MAQHIDIQSAAQLSGRALFSAIRNAAAGVYQLPLATRERLVAEAAQISPMHALLYLGLDQADCLERLNGALASNGPEALSWATFALAQPKHELSEPMRQRKIQLLSLVVNNAEHVSVFCIESATVKPSSAGLRPETRSTNPLFRLAHLEKKLSMLVSSAKTSEKTTCYRISCCQRCVLCARKVIAST